jgi:hypothetical protein
MEAVRNTLSGNRQPIWKVLLLSKPPRITARVKRGLLGEDRRSEPFCGTGIADVASESRGNVVVGHLAGRRISCLALLPCHRVWYTRFRLDS